MTPRSVYPTNDDLRLDYIGRYGMLLTRNQMVCYYNQAEYQGNHKHLLAAVTSLTVGTLPRLQD